MKSKLAILLLFFVIVLAIFTRSYDFRNRLAFDHDSDLAAWIVKDIYVDGHLRLIGQLTSAPGVFIGGLFYYSLIPFYVISSFNPLGTALYSWIIGVVGVISMFYVVESLHGKKAALISSIIYAGSFGISTTERQVVPTMLIFIWSIWFYYGVNKLFSGKYKSLNLLAVLFSLVWHIQLNLSILALLVILGVVLNLKKIPLKILFSSLLIFISLSSPLIIFELRHGFTQVSSIFGSVKKTEDVSRTKSEKFIHVTEYVSRNINYIFYERPQTIPSNFLPILLIASLAYLVYKKIFTGFQTLIILSWIGAFVIFFVVHPINLSEYYLNALQIIWIIIFSVLLSSLHNKFRSLIIVVILIFMIHNLNRVFEFNPNRYGLKERMQLVNYIKVDSLNHGYDCVAISYITDRGYDLGYRFLIWHSGIKTGKISNDIPVYSIVFPLSRVDRFDQSFGSLGLILPPHAKFSNELVNGKCQEKDLNIEDTMFGFTK